MGRVAWGSTNLGIRNNLYYSCFRSRSGIVCNFSMSNYIRTSISPQLYNGNSGSTNSNFGTYVCNKGYAYGIALVNSRQRLPPEHQIQLPKQKRRMCLAHSRRERFS